MELSQYVLEDLRRDEEFVLYRGEPSNQPGSPSVLLLSPASMQPENYGETTLVLEDPSGEPLDRFLSGPMQMPPFVGLAIGLATALGGLHKRELIHKDVKPANVW